MMTLIRMYRNDNAGWWLAEGLTGCSWGMFGMLWLCSQLLHGQWIRWYCDPQLVGFCWSLQKLRVSSNSQYWGPVCMHPACFPGIAHLSFKSTTELCSSATLHLIWAIPEIRVMPAEDYKCPPIPIVTPSPHQGPRKRRACAGAWPPNEAASMDEATQNTEGICFCLEPTLVN